MKIGKCASISIVLVMVFTLGQGTDVTGDLSWSVIMVGD